MAEGLIMRALFLILAMMWSADDWQGGFAVDKKTLTSTGGGQYLKLEPGLRMEYAEGQTAVVIEVTKDTRVVDGVETRVVLETETKGGHLVESTRDYFAADAKTGDVYYFGEDVDEYKNGKLTGHGGSWLSGVKGARFGLMMPGAPKAGQKYYQEQAPGVGMDRAEIVSLAERVVTPAGTYEKCLHVKETNALEPGAVEHKWYAPGVGLVKDGGAVLVKVARK